MSSKRKYPKGYICGTDLTDLWMGAADVVIYPSAAVLKQNRTCWQQCGILEFVIKPKVIVKENFAGLLKK